MKSYRIVLADDHVLFRQGLRKIIEGSGDLEVIAETGSGLDLLNLLRRVTADLVILDIAMPGLRGLEALHEMKAIQPRPKALMLTMHADREYVREALSAGASGYLLKEDADAQLFSAIEQIRRDRIYLSRRLADDLMQTWAGGPGKVDGERAFETMRLTVREREILKLIAEAKSSREIADALNISTRTVEHHRASILSKLNLKRTVELVRYAASNGYV